LLPQYNSQFVDFAAVADAVNDNKILILADFVNDAIVTDPEFEES